MMKINRFRNTKKILSLVMSGVMFLSAPVFTYVYADELTDAKDKYQDVNDQIDDATQKLKEGKAQATKLGNQIYSLEKQIYTAESEINRLTAELNDTKDKISSKMAELSVMEANIRGQNNDLDARLRAMYKNGGVGMLAVLLGSSDMSSFLTNVEFVKRIFNADSELLSQMQAEYDIVEEKKAELLDLKDQLQTQQDEINTKKTGLNSQKTTLADLKSQVDGDNKELEAQIDALNKEANALTAEILKLQGSDEYIGGTLLWPCADSRHLITSPFGNRMHPILKVYKMHTGIDIGAAKGTSIYAANAGKVITAAYNSSYGYFVMIDHGGGIVTLYAHSSKLLVEKNDIVKRGDVIALVGSTGMSTGPHLHFEVRVNGVYKNPLDYVVK